MPHDSRLDAALRRQPALQFAVQFLFCPLITMPLDLAVLVALGVVLRSDPWFWTFLGSYVVYIALDPSPYSGGYRHPWLNLRSHLLWKITNDYYPIRIVKTADLPATDGQQYLFGCHPHGIIGAGASGAFAINGAGFDELFPGIARKLHVLPFCLRLPFRREIFLASGCVDASRRSIAYTLSHGLSGAIVPGGAEEALMADRNAVRLKLRSRKGFIKLALQHGVQLVPVFSFGELEIYKPYSVENLRRVKQALKKFLTFSTPLFCGRFWWLPTFPIRTPIHVVVGAPFSPPTAPIPEPTDAQVNEEHRLYMQALRAHYQKHREAYGYGERELLIE